MAINKAFRVVIGLTSLFSVMHRKKLRLDYAG